jgi:hypothetical protein
MNVTLESGPFSAGHSIFNIAHFVAVVRRSELQSTARRSHGARAA